MKKNQHAREVFVHNQIQGTVKCQENAGNMVKFYKDIGRTYDAERAINEVIEYDNQRVALKAKLVRLKEVSDPSDPLSRCSFKTSRIESKIRTPPP